MSPVAHTALGALGWQWFAKEKKITSLGLFILISNLPDIDFIVFFITNGVHGFSLHQLYTHNLFFVSITALLCWPFLSGKKERWGFLLTAYSHLLLDFLTIDGAPPFGFRALYPVSDTLFNFGLFPNMIKANMAEVFSLQNVLVVCFEIAVFWLPLLLIYRKTFAGYFRKRENTMEV